MSDTELLLPAARLFFRIWEKLNFPVGLPESEWPKLETLNEAARDNFFSRPRDLSASRLIKETIDNYPKKYKGTGA